ncbi:S49 family peptidase [Ochrobactrum tritici]|uniref:S49 family peptidase n=1 Tax=Brucella tritici TaxID=94626 RepID=A0A7X6JCG1_9HYPH|nr:S49 family peptidase [Brucella tritici]
MRDLPHIAAMIFNRPLLLRDDVGRNIIESVAHRILRGEAVKPSELPKAERAKPRMISGGARHFSCGAYMAMDGIAVFPIVGSLVRRASWLDAECGLMSYDAIREGVTEILTDPSVRGLLLEIDSGGGEASGCFDCADFIRLASEQTGKPVWAHANEVACSAAYALATSGDVLVLARTAEVGSIGVVAAHCDLTEQDKKRA